MITVGETQYEDAPEVLELLREVVREHDAAVGYMALVEGHLHATIVTPKPKPPPKPKKLPPPRPGVPLDEPEAKSEQPPAKPPHLEVLKLGPVKPEIRARPGNGKLIASIRVRGDIWALMSRQQRKLALLERICLAHKVTVPEDGGEPKIGKAPLPIQTHPYVIRVGGAWWEGLDPSACADASGEVDVAATLLGEDEETPRRTAADLPRDALAADTDDDDES